MHTLVANLVNQLELMMVNIYRGIKFPVNHDKITLRNHERKKPLFLVKLQS